MDKEPIEWERIKVAAHALGARDWAVRKWAQRERVPPGWQIKIGKSLRVDPELITPPIPTTQRETANG